MQAQESTKKIETMSSQLESKTQLIQTLQEQLDQLKLETVKVQTPGVEVGDTFYL